VATTVLTGLGQALRWLRDRLGKKQYQVADAAGITKGMLSAYETGRQNPSLETLQKILGTLGCSLHDLHNAIQIVNGRPEAIHSPLAHGELGEREERSGALAPRRPASRRGGYPDIYSILGQTDPLPPELERALGQLVEGFHHFIRYLHRSMPAELLGEEPERPEPSEHEDEPTP
jgi:transcriptional regulator with XRE-family HTH domain